VSSSKAQQQDYDKQQGSGEGGDAGYHTHAARQALPKMMQTHDGDVVVAMSARRSSIPVAVRMMQ